MKNKNLNQNVTFFNKKISQIFLKTVHTDKHDQF